MGAYILVELSIINKESYEEYKKLAPSSISFYHGNAVIPPIPGTLL